MNIGPLKLACPGRKKLHFSLTDDDRGTRVYVDTDMDNTEDILQFIEDRWDSRFREEFLLADDRNMEDGIDSAKGFIICRKGEYFIEFTHYQRCSSSRWWRSYEPAELITPSND